MILLFVLGGLAGSGLGTAFTIWVYGAMLDRRIKLADAAIRALEDERELLDIIHREWWAWRRTWES